MGGGRPVRLAARTAAVQMNPQNPDDQPLPLSDLLKKIVRKSKPSQKALKGRRLAQKVLAEPPIGLAGKASVVSVKLGIVTIETNSAALFQEIEGFQKQKLIEAFRAAGVNVKEVRVKLL